MNKNLFPQYTIDYISGCMSLRKPQKESLRRLENIMENVNVTKDIDLSKALPTVHNLYPTCKNFERDFLSMTFALATGVGKTRLMGAFITYLYTQYGIKNFFVVAPAITVYDKLKADLGNPDNPKYVFKGIGCFSNPPQVIADDDYMQKNISLFASEIRIFVFNIAKFNSEDVNMRKLNEVLGDSFYNYLASLPDLVMVMDESHHYRAENSAKALDELHPILGLELTATPLVNKGGKQVPFKNVVYEYPLSMAIADGYTRTPYAIGRANTQFYNFEEKQLDKLMLQDGIKNHESAKNKLLVYAENHGKRIVKPFMLVVCMNTKHAEWVNSYIQSDEFCNGHYKNKVIMVHSAQRGAEKESNIKMLLDVERYDNPIEIVIHVNMLKEGWDVNNLYTIVPLRTATSKILREQMVGRGLRLPYGERTGDPDVDAVRLTAHDKFSEILEEAQKGDSIFKAGNIIDVDDIPEEKVSQTQLTLDFGDGQDLEDAYNETQIPKSENSDELIKTAKRKIQRKLTKELKDSPDHQVSKEQKKKIVEEVKKEIEDDKDIGITYKENAMPIGAWLWKETEEQHRVIVNHYIPIPKIKVTDEGDEDYYFEDFDLDLAEFNEVPIKNEILIQNLEDPADLTRVKGDNVIDLGGYEPKKVILKELCDKAEIDYEKCSKLLFKLITQVYDHFNSQFNEDETKNIVMMYKKNISNKIYNQMMKHFSCINSSIIETVVGVRTYNLPSTYGFSEVKNLYESYDGEIKSILFEGIKKGVFSTAKFDSRPELILARVMEKDKDVKNWLRPAMNEFDITYNHGHRYEPDFVVEVDDKIYLVEVKGEDKLTNPDVVAKKERGIQYCRVASHWGKANGYKEWQYLFIPSKEVQATSTFNNLSARFREF